MKTNGDLSDYPELPVGPNFGTPPSKFYILLYEITTSADPSSPSPPPYNSGTLTLPTTWSKNNFWVDEISFGAPVCIDNVTTIQQRMSARAVSGWPGERETGRWENPANHNYYMEWQSDGSIKLFYNSVEQEGFWPVLPP
jgi:hypothetical protein